MGYGGYGVKLLFAVEASRLDVELGFLDCFIFPSLYPVPQNCPDVSEGVIVLNSMKHSAPKPQR